MKKISWDDFEKVNLQVGTIIRVEDFPEARKPAYKIWVDLGDELGIKKSSAQIKDLYSKDELLHKQVLCVTNFPEKQIANFMSEVLVTGFPDEKGNVILAGTDKKVPNGSKLF